MAIFGRPRRRHLPALTLLNPANQYAIDRIGVYLARYATTIAWPAGTLLPELTG